MAHHGNHSMNHIFFWNNMKIGFKECVFMHVLLQLFYQALLWHWCESFCDEDFEEIEIEIEMMDGYKNTLMVSEFGSLNNISEISSARAMEMGLLSSHSLQVHIIMFNGSSFFGKKDNPMFFFGSCIRLISFLFMGKPWKLFHVQVEFKRKCHYRINHWRYDSFGYFCLVLK